MPDRRRPPVAVADPVTEQTHGYRYWDCDTSTVTATDTRRDWDTDTDTCEKLAQRDFTTTYSGIYHDDPSDICTFTKFNSDPQRNFIKAKMTQLCKRRYLCRSLINDRWRVNENINAWIFINLWSAQEGVGKEKIYKYSKCEQTWTNYSQNSRLKLINWN